MDRVCNKKTDGNEKAQKKVKTSQMQKQKKIITLANDI